MPAERRNGSLYFQIFCAAGIALFCWLALYAYPSADDYIYSHAVVERGFWPQQAYMFMHWAGRLFHIFLLSAATRLPMESCYWLFPLLTLLAYGAALRFFLGTVLPRDKARLLTLPLTACTLALLTSLNQTLYWLCGMTYFWAGTLLLASGALALQAFRGSKGAFWLCLPVLFLNGTLLEQPCILQGIAAFLAGLCFLRRGEKRRAWMAGAFWLVSVAAFLLLFLAPGTAERMGAYAKAPFLPRLARTFAVAAAFGSFTALKFFLKPLVWAVLLFLPDAARAVEPSRLVPRLRAWHVLLVTALIPFLMQAIAAWPSGEGLPLRAESLTVWMMGAAWVLLWSFGYRREALPAKLGRWRWVLLALCLAASSNFVNAARDLGTAPLFAAENLARTEAARRQKGAPEAVIPLLETRPALLFFTDLRPWPSDWKNQAYAKYHDIGRVAAWPRPLCASAAGLLKEGETAPLARLAAGNEALAFLMGEMHDPAFAPMRGVPKDAGKAAEWYLKAAEAGNVQACRRLTRLYFHGGEPREAAYWFLRYELLSVLWGDGP